MNTFVSTPLCVLTTTNCTTPRFVFHPKHFLKTFPQTSAFQTLPPRRTIIAPEEVAEITVLTMQGRQVATFSNDHRFNVSTLAKAGYIVRVATTEGKVHYLKLVKQ